MRAVDLREGSELAGYRIEDVIGRGGMGVVYRAYEPELDRRVAIKVLAPELAHDSRFRERFENEMRVAASLEHPHVCPVYRAGAADGELFVVMRLIDGDDLAAKVARDGSLEPRLACELLSQIASGLDHAHARGLLHRDVKPENVLVDSDGRAYLTDFGLAVDVLGKDEAGVLAGTLAYLAPERCQGEPAQPASDQYALACFAYVLVTGSPPFPREHEAALLYAHMRDEPPTLEDHGLSRLDPVLRQALAKSPGDRYPSCRDFIEDFALAVRRREPTVGEGWPEGLPRPFARLVGRRRELGEVAVLLQDPETRLLTLTGPGGTGKTKLLLHAAAEVAPAFPDGVFWVPLAPVRDPSLVLTTVAQALEVSETSDLSLVDTLTEAFRSRRALLVVDNCEHLIDSAAEVVRALVECTSELVVATSSRERLRLRSERVFAVPPLEPVDSETLFTERARAVHAGFEADANVSAICDAVDRLPLAIELAAARVRSISTEAILERLGKRLALLSTRDRDVDDRQRTLEATIAWSYELLDLDEQRALRALSVFAGGCTLDAALDVAHADLERLESLLDRSLVRYRVDEAGHDRYWMLETIREFAAERLESSGEAGAVSVAYTSFFVGAARQFDSIPGRGATSEEFARFREDRANFRLALQSAIDDRDAGSALRLVRSLGWFWYWLRELADGYAVARQALDLEGGDQTDRAYALMCAAQLAVDLGDVAEARGMLDDAERILETVGDVRGLALAGNYRSFLEYVHGDHSAAIEAAERSIELAKEVGDQDLEMSATSQLSSALQGLALESDVLDKESLERSRSLDEARLHWDRAQGSPVREAIALSNLAFTLCLLGEYGEALRHAQQSVRIQLDSGKQRVSEDLLNIGCIAVGIGLPRDGARLVATALRDYRREGIALQAVDHRLLRDAEAAAKVALGEAYDEVVQEGEASTTDEAVALALDLVPPKT